MSVSKPILTGYAHASVASPSGMQIRSMLVALSHPLETV